MNLDHAVALLQSGRPLHKQFEEGSAIWFFEEPYEQVPAGVALKAIHIARAVPQGDGMFDPSLSQTYRLPTPAQVAERRAWLDEVCETINFAGKLKARMLKLEKRNVKVECFRCKGWVHARLCGPRNHLHMACTTAGCATRMME